MKKVLIILVIVILSAQSFSMSSNRIFKSRSAVPGIPIPPV